MERATGVWAAAASETIVCLRRAICHTGESEMVLLPSMERRHLLRMNERLGAAPSTPVVVLASHMITVATVDRVGEEVKVVQLPSLKEGRGPLLVRMNASDVEIRVTIRLLVIMGSLDRDGSLTVVDDLNLVCFVSGSSAEAVLFGRVAVAHALRLVVGIARHLEVISSSEHLEDIC